ncbi:hypothetical protein [Winogradskyella sp.]|uniref:hypothetical protein n=1 Tax=Winogradskyella sp. TaxID=1883156 RepID=UPI0026126B09|nr:hypothetical protein [Winogradskyella sp.]
MKKILVFVMLSVVTLHAQKELTFIENINSSQDIYLNFKFAQNIKVEHGNSNEVTVKVSVNIDDGEGNTYFNVLTERSSDSLKMYSDFGDYFKNKRNDKGKNSWNCNSVTEIDYVVMVPKGVNLKIKSISGDVYMDSFQGDLVTDLISGDVTIKKYEGELRLKTISGALDVIVSRADLSAKSITGTIYSDIDFKPEVNSKAYHRSYNKVTKKINGGTQPLHMETISGNIYIRKG